MAQAQPLDRVVIRFAGDSGDGIQLTGDRFTAESASRGNDIATLPNFQAEIRAPQGTLPGVFTFQLHFADFEIATTADVDPPMIVVHDQTSPDPSQAFAISRFTESGVLSPAPVRIFRRLQRPAYDDLMREQIAATGDDHTAALAAIIAGQDPWEVGQA